MKAVETLCLLLAIYSKASGDQSSRISRQAGVCGSSVRSTGNIVHGSSFQRGDYPWMVALMYTGTSPPSFFCGGTLISLRHVITAAHCIKPKYGQAESEEYYPNDVLALFGAYNLTNSYESERFALSPDEIRIHEQWNIHIERYDADIAILKFSPNLITITRFIQPVCLWSSLSAPTETDGIIAGWGKNEDKSQLYQPIPKLVKVPIYTNEICFLETPGLAKISSTRTFCAGAIDGSGVCFGDSGNGYFIKSGDLLYLRGIVSSSLKKGTSCDVTRYAVYTDVLKFKKWINKIIGESIPVGFQSSQTQGNNYVRPDPGTCGVSDFKTSSRVKRIISPIGTVARGQFPWLAAIYWYCARYSEHPQFFCGGSMVSQTVIVTAAHCFADSIGERKKAEALNVYLGKSNLESLQEEGSVWSAVSEIIIHPDWKPDTGSRDANIAALILSRTVVPSKFIKPICIWPSTNSFDDLIGSKGIVAGWGYTSATAKILSLEQPQWTEVKVVTQETCLRSDAMFISLTSHRTFCAKDDAGLIGPCNGDAGAGFLAKKGGKWYLHGIVSASLVNDGICDIKSFAVYTNVAQFNDWLKELISRYG